jgi:hypothetical protein
VASFKLHGVRSSDIRPLSGHGGLLMAFICGKADRMTGDLPVDRRQTIWSARAPNPRIAGQQPRETMSVNLLRTDEPVSLG